MATTRDRLEELTGHQGELPDHHGVMLEDRLTGAAAGATVPGPDRPAVAIPRRSLRQRLLEPIPGRWGAIGAVAWVTLLGIGIAVEPPPANPNAVDPWFLDALAAVLLAAVMGAFVGFAQRRRWSMAASLLASGLLVVSTLACPASGHHTQVGAWWAVQLGCGLGLLTTSILGLRRA
jgi:peptidoglycan/LPS O-acetylase OafA/YrhL